ncbi:MAG: cation:H+ antiporter [Gammaproteobacteria bacterium]|jgi:cation:H+ antiporter
MLINSLYTIAGLCLLIFGADRFVVGAASIARSLNISPLIIGLTIVGIATSAPEVLVGSVAALDGKTALAVGNAIGSNIANIGLVLGVSALACPLVVKSLTLRREFLVMCAATGVAFFVLLDGQLDRLDGLILIVCLVAAMLWIIQLAKASSKSDPLVNEFEHELAEEQSISIGKSCLFLFIGLTLLLIGAELLVRGAVAIAQEFGLSDLVIGLTIVAVGTSLPELAASVSSAMKNEADIAIGNIIGSNMFNMLMVLGVPALIQPAEVGADVMHRDFPIMIFLTLLMGWMVFFHGRGKFDRVEGGFLFLCFIAYQYWLFSSISV